MKKIVSAWPDYTETVLHAFKNFVEIDLHSIFHPDQGIADHSPLYRGYE